MIQKAFQLGSILPYCDLMLVDLSDVELYAEYTHKLLRWNDPPKVVTERLSTAKIIYMHQNGFDKWTDILLYIQQRKPLPVKLFIYFGSDYCIGEEHMEIMTAFFPNTEFWIQNWFGTFPTCKLLPIGTNSMVSNMLPKSKPLGISFLLNYIGNEKREDFFTFLDKTPGILPYCLPKGNFQEYMKSLSECYYSVCPMGEGYDTFRFWESLLVGSIPIVKDHPFYDILEHYYPNIPIYRVKEWDDLLTFISEFDTNKYNEKMQNADLSCLEEDFWISKIKTIIHDQEFAENNDSVPSHNSL